MQSVYIYSPKIALFSLFIYCDNLPMIRNLIIINSFINNKCCGVSVKGIKVAIIAYIITVGSSLSNYYLCSLEVIKTNTLAVV